jgi:two-component system response regulator AtoC
MIARLKDTHTPVLITGESGTGKELVARAIHFRGSYAKRPFIAVECSSLVPTLIESELFGYEKGAFTGAQKSKPGLFQAADGGTIFLDEIGELPLELQAKLLRVLQEKEVRPVGSNDRHTVDVRVIAATNRDLESAYRTGTFRKDLYFRLNVLTLTVPPLRERRADILPLADHLLVTLRSVHGRPNVRLSDAARRMLAAYAWPGNVRELRNALERAVVFSRVGRGAPAAKGDLLEPENFPENIRSAAPGAASMVAGLRSLEEVEREVITATLEATHYQISRSAEALGISRKTLLEKRKKYGLK